MRELKCLRIAKALLHTAVISAVYMLMSICLAAVPSAGRIIRTADYATRSEAVGAAVAGDAVVFEDKKKGDDDRIIISKPVKDIQFFSAEGIWELNSDMEDCLFYGARIKLDQNSGKIRRSIFHNIHYASSFNCTYVDSVLFNYAGAFIPYTGGTRLRLSNFVRGATILKFKINGGTGIDPLTAWKDSPEPFLVIDATDPVGDGRGTYIISPIIWQQRAWTPFHIINGRAITLAHINTEYNRWSDAVMNIDNGIDCVVLCNGIGAASMLTDDAYKSQPSLITYADHTEWGLPLDNAPWRGAVFRMAGQRNKVVAQGKYKTWTSGLKGWLPSCHYEDAVVMKDPFAQNWPCGNIQWGVSINFSEPKNVFLLEGASLTSSDVNSPCRFPLKGIDLQQPVFLRIPDLRTGNPAVSKVAAPLTMNAIYNALAANKTVRLGKGTYVFNRTLTGGMLVGEGMDKTICEFGTTDICARGSFKGFQNLTVRGGRLGYVTEGLYIGKDFCKVRFDGQNTCILIAGNSQNDIIFNAEFVNSATGIAVGSRSEIGSHGGNPNDPNIDKLDIANCTFKNLSDAGIRLSCYPEQNGQVAVSGCTFEEIGGPAIKISGGMTHLVQGCSITNACKKNATEPVIYIFSKAALAASHIDITGGNGATGIHLEGIGPVVSHARISGCGTAVKLEAESGSVEVDNVSGADGTIDIPMVQYNYVANSQFKNLENRNKVHVVYNGAFFDVTNSAGIQPLDTTPPPDVTGLKVTSQSDANILEWTAVNDPESGTNNYAIFVNGQEIGRTPLVQEIRGNFGFLSAPVKTTTWRDSAKSATAQSYLVKAINGANLLSGGGKAELRAWMPVYGQFFDLQNNEVVIQSIDAAAQTITIKGGKIIPYSELNPAGAPKYIVEMPGEIVKQATTTRARIVEYSGSPEPVIAQDFFIAGSDGEAVLKLYDLTGAEICEVVRSAAKSGQRIAFSLPRDLPNGAYVLRYQGPGINKARQFIAGHRAVRGTTAYGRSSLLLRH